MLLVLLEFFEQYLFYVCKNAGKDSGRGGSMKANECQQAQGSSGIRVSWVVIPGYCCTATDLVMSPCKKVLLHNESSRVDAFSSPGRTL
jgi:hypothetical protein